MTAPGTVDPTVNSSKVEPGMVRVPPPTGWATRLDVGTSFTNAYLIVKHDGPESVTLLGITPDVEDGLEYLGAFVSGIDRSIPYTDILPDFPPTDKRLGTIRPAEGAVFPASDNPLVADMGILMGFKVTREGRFVMDKVTIRYAVGGKIFTKVAPVTMAICTPGKAEQECPHHHGSNG